MSISKLLFSLSDLCDLQIENHLTQIPLDQLHSLILREPCHLGVDINALFDNEQKVAVGVTSYYRLGHGCVPYE